MPAITKLGPHGTPARNYGVSVVVTPPVIPPYVAGLPRITYNGNNIDFPVDAYILEIDQQMFGLSNFSASGTEEYLAVSLEVGVKVTFRGFLNANSTHQQLRQDIQQWDIWAQLKLPWTFARDRNETILTTLSAAASAGATTLALTTTASIREGALYVVRSKDVKDLVKVFTVDTTSQVTLTRPLLNSYEAGSRFRSEQFWPCRLEEGYSNPIIEQPSYHGFEIGFYAREDVNSL
jgi:hypothetical protein